MHLYVDLILGTTALFHLSHVYVRICLKYGMDQFPVSLPWCIKICFHYLSSISPAHPGCQP
jgi:hypothetical protein